MKELYIDFCVPVDEYEVKTFSANHVGATIAVRETGRADQCARTVTA